MSLHISYTEIHAAIPFLLHDIVDTIYYYLANDITHICDCLFAIRSRNTKMLNIVIPKRCPSFIFNLALSFSMNIKKEITHKIQVPKPLSLQKIDNDIRAEFKLLHQKYLQEKELGSILYLRSKYPNFVDQSFLNVLGAPNFPSANTQEAVKEEVNLIFLKLYDRYLTNKQYGAISQLYFYHPDLQMKLLSTLNSRVEYKISNNLKIYFIFAILDRSQIQKAYIFGECQEREFLDHMADDLQQNEALKDEYKIIFHYIFCSYSNIRGGYCTKRGIFGNCPNKVVNMELFCQNCRQRCDAVSTYRDFRYDKYAPIEIPDRYGKLIKYEVTPQPLYFYSTQYPWLIFKLTIGPHNSRSLSLYGKLVNSKIEDLDLDSQRHFSILLGVPIYLK